MVAGFISFGFSVLSTKQLLSLSASMLSSITFYTLLRTLMHSECFVWFGLGFFNPLGVTVKMYLIYLSSFFTWVSVCPLLCDYTTYVSGIQRNQKKVLNPWN